ncbi:MAG: crotonase/enoyl-CoA hydratase family protein, partial [Candidatus Binatia bacterium]
IAAFPQDCLRSDRESAYGQAALAFDDAMRHEFEAGLRALASPELGEGVGRFRAGRGRHGSFDG